MQRALYMAGLLIAMNTLAAAQEVPPAELADGFVSMFNGRDFSGWQFGEGYHLPTKSPANNWQVADGVIQVAANGKGNVGSQWDYVDFDMRFQWRAMRDRYNSGFYIRSNRKVGNNQINLAKGGEGRFFGGKMVGGPAVPELQKPAMEWNDWRVVVVGDKVSFYCNDKLAWEGTEFASPRGHIGFQAEGAPLEFRNLRIKELDRQSLNHLDHWQPNKSWQPAGDALATDGAGEPLVTKNQEYGDYVLRLEWKADKQAAAGIGLRGAEAKGGIIQLGGEAGSGGLAGAAPSKTIDNPAGEWNYLEATVQNDQATVTLNGVVTLENVSLRETAEQGPIALIPGGQAMEFRNVRVKPLTK